MRRLPLLAVLALAACDTLIVSPAYAQVLPGQVLQLVTNQATPLWTVQEAGGGTVSTTGTYQAPPCSPTVAGTYHVIVSANGQTATSTITVEDPIVSVAISPASVTLRPGQTQQFTATLTRFCGGQTVATNTVTAPRLAAKVAPR